MFVKDWIFLRIWIVRFYFCVMIFKLMWKYAPLYYVSRFDFVSDCIPVYRVEQLRCIRFYYQVVLSRHALTLQATFYVYSNLNFLILNFGLFSPLSPWLLKLVMSPLICEWPFFVEKILSDISVSVYDVYISSDLK